jgi:drug/metabolite transporter (DMT)-like permease
MVLIYFVTDHGGRCTLSHVGGIVNRNATLVGIVAALGISVTAAIALPLVNVFKTLSTGELMMIRGGVSAILIAALFPRRISLATVNVFLFSFLFSSANYCLYNGIRSWGANPTIVILTTTPIVNIFAKWWRGNGIDVRVAGSLATLLLGVLIALNPWQTPFDLHGFLWSVTATLLIGVGFEILGATKNLDPYHKSFWIAMLMVLIGLATTVAVAGRIPFSVEAWSAEHVVALLLYGLTGGFLYILANVIAFEKLKTEVASVLAMGETPAVVLGAWLTLGERLSPIQWGGVILALGATAALSAAEAKKATQTN